MSPTGIAMTPRGGNRLRKDVLLTAASSRPRRSSAVTTKAQAENVVAHFPRLLPRAKSGRQKVSMNEWLARKASKQQHYSRDSDQLANFKRQRRHSSRPAEAGTVNLPMKNFGSNASSRLLALPAELRNEIWQYAVYSDKSLAIVGPTPSQPALTRVCRQIRSEAICYFYTINTFKCTIVNYDPVDLKCYRQTADKYGLNIVVLTHRLDPNAPRELLRKNLLKWLEGTIKGEAAPLGYSSGHSDQSYAWNKLVHRLVKVFNMAKMLRNHHLPWAVAKDILGNAVDAAGVCGEKSR